MKSKFLFCRALAIASVYLHSSHLELMHSTFELARYRVHLHVNAVSTTIPVTVLVFEVTTVKFSPRRLTQPHNLSISGTFADQHSISIDNRRNIECKKTRLWRALCAVM